MTGRCCTGMRPSRRLARRLSGGAASLLPGTGLVLLPKCPLCLAAWITACTGVALPTMVSSSIRPFLVIACVLSASLLIWRAIGRFRLARSPFFRPLRRLQGGATSTAMRDPPKKNGIRGDYPPLSAFTDFVRMARKPDADAF
jgi:hypothetical protein